jgi:hypothetical protein
MMKQGTTKPEETPQTQISLPYQSPHPPTEINKEKRSEYNLSHAKWDNAIVRNADASTN